MALDYIQGVTLLAFGNGAPDVFSSLAAITNAKHGDVGLAFGALLGLCLTYQHISIEYPLKYFNICKSVNSHTLISGYLYKNKCIIILV